MEREDVAPADAEKLLASHGKDITNKEPLELQKSAEVETDKKLLGLHETACSISQATGAHSGVGH